MAKLAYSKLKLKTEIPTAQIEIPVGDDIHIVEVKTYLAVSVLGKSLNLNINYKKINVPELDMGEKDVNIYLPMRYKEAGTVEGNE